ncbi:MAG: DUF3341 domain-containing protein [Myxococcota bacterium]
MNDKQQGTPWGLLAVYDSPGALTQACRSVRDAGYTKWDAYTPFPVHGLDKAMGLRKSGLAWFVLIAGLLGGIGMLGFMLWAASVNYPLNIGGKPPWSVPAFIPVMFEVTILCSALTAVFGMLALNGLPRWHHPLFAARPFEQVTDDCFCLAIQTDDPRFNPEQTAQLLRQTGAQRIETVPWGPASPFASKGFDESRSSERIQGKPSD